MLMSLYLKTLIVVSLSLLCISSAYADKTSDEVDYGQFRGLIIRNVKLKIVDVFEGKELSKFYRVANDLKMSTKRDVIRREFLFKKGDEFDPFLVSETKRILRTLGFLRRIRIIPTKVGTSEVDLLVSVQDTWTLIPQVGFSSGDGSDSRSVGVSESDLLGYGKTLGVGYSETDNRKKIQTVYDDPRVWGTYHRLRLTHFERTDGDFSSVFFGRPFRSFVEPFSWTSTISHEDTIGRLFQHGNERYIYRRRHFLFDLDFSLARVKNLEAVGRYSLGYKYSSEDFNSANDKDFEDLSLDPDLVSRDSALLAEDRRFSGPTLSYSEIDPEFVSMNYIDRFDRVEDYNLGKQVLIDTQIAPDFLGSDHDAMLFSLSRAGGEKFSKESFFRFELGMGSRLEKSGLSNTLYSFESKYYNVLGPLFSGDLFLGRHTLAANFGFDYGNDFDLDRELLIGADNGLRGYVSRAFTGDKRIVFNVEDRVHLVDDVLKLFSLGAAAFFDAGGATNASISDLIQDNIYSDVGVGLRIGFPRSSGGQVLRIDLALPLRSGPDDEGSGAFEPRIIFSGGQLFDSFTSSERAGERAAASSIGFDR